MRYFVNSLEDFVPGSSVQVNKDVWRQKILTLVQQISENLPSTCTENSCHYGVYIGAAGIAYMFYGLAKNGELESQRREFLDSAMAYSKVCAEYIQQGGYHKPNFPTSSVIIGIPGCDMSASLVADLAGDVQKSQECAQKFANAAETFKPIDFCSRGSDEWLFGRAGYLICAFMLEKKLGRKVMKEGDIAQLCAVTIESGRAYAKKRASKSPLMFHFTDKMLLGAAHGLSGILQALMSFPEYLRSDPDAERDVRGAVDFVLSQEQANYNYPPGLEETPSDDEELLHWCHGAPGVVYMFARAFLLWRDDKYLQASLRCGEVTWQKGLLRKGPGICHGVAGSGYVFLLLYRLTGDQKHLHRAAKFAAFMDSPEFQKEARTPDRPYSLYEGLAGTVCFLADLLQPDKAEFPLFDVFVD